MEQSCYIAAVLPNDGSGEETDRPTGDEPGENDKVPDNPPEDQGQVVRPDQAEDSEQNNLNDRAEAVILSPPVLLN